MPEKDRENEENNHQNSEDGYRCAVTHGFKEECKKQRCENISQSEERIAKITGPGRILTFKEYDRYEGIPHRVQ